KRPPSEHIAGGQIFVACDPDEKMLPQVLELIGEDVVIYASDYCHWDSRFPDSVRLIEDRSELSQRQKRKILGENALRFFGFKERELGRRAA
ncbi:MAG TPA: amidohydrolase family protein, partial [Candidatus Binatia bacterium]